MARGHAGAGRRRFRGDGRSRAALWGGVAFADYEGFRAGVAALLDDPGARAGMGARGRSYVLEEYGWPAVWERLETVAGRLAA